MTETVVTSVPNEDKIMGILNALNYIQSKFLFQHSDPIYLVRLFANYIKLNTGVINYKRKFRIKRRTTPIITEM